MSANDIRELENLDKIPAENGGDCIAASQIYAMLMDYKGDVTIKIDGIAASAASVIAMAGTTVLMAPTSLMMILWL